MIEFSSMQQFPNFTKLDISHKNFVESIVKKHLPYSDFNFISLYCWNTDKKTKISILNNNLILQMKDYSSDNTIYSFIGDHKIIETAKELLLHAEKNNIKELKLIPESMILNNNFDSAGLIVEEDRDQFDYIYKTEEIIKLEGSKFKKKRNMLKRFIKENSKKMSVKKIDLKDKEIQLAVKKMIKNWQENKIKSGKKIEKDELIALDNAIQLAGKLDLIGVGVYIGNEMIGFTIGELIHKDHSMIHFEKTNQVYPGVTEFVMSETAKIHSGKGSTWLNYQQDVGEENLRVAKSFWRPSHFLKKYRIRLKK